MVGTVIGIMIYLVIAVLVHAFCRERGFNKIQATILAASWPGAAVLLLILFAITGY